MKKTNVFILIMLCVAAICFAGETEPAAESSGVMSIVAIVLSAVISISAVAVAVEKIKRIVAAVVVLMQLILASLDDGAIEPRELVEIKQQAKEVIAAFKAKK